MVMTKKLRNILIISGAALVAAAGIVTGVLLWQSKKEPIPTDADALQVKFLDTVPDAYLGETYDAGAILEKEEGVTYTMAASYLDVDAFAEMPLTVEGLTFRQDVLFDVDVVVTAARGEESAKGSKTIKVKVKADPIDEMLITNGACGWADVGIFKELNSDKTYIKGDDSNSSVAVKFQGSDAHDWGTVAFSVASFKILPLWTDQAWENAVLSFWVFNPMPADFEFALRIADKESGVDIDWGANTVPQIAKAGEWTQINFSMRKLGIAHPLYKDEAMTRTDELNVKIRYTARPDREALNNLYDYSLYVDGMDVIDASAFPGLDTEMEATTEPISQGWENMTQDTGFQGVTTKYDYKLAKGDGSVCSLRMAFDGDKAGDSPFMVLSPEVDVLTGRLDALPDMTSGTLTGYFRFEKADPAVSLQLFKNVGDNWLNTAAQPMKLEKLADGWYKATMDMTAVEFEGKLDNSEIIRLKFDFSGTGKNSVIHMDTLKFAPSDAKPMAKESAEEDWINLSIDAGMTNVQFNRVGDHLKAPGSVRSAKVVSPAGTPGNLVFNPEASLAAGTIKKLPGFRKGTVHAYFYFGDQTPAASMKIINTLWHTSSEVAFQMTAVDGADGWYYGSIPTSLFTGFPAGDASAIIRMQLIFPAGSTVYVDGFTLNEKEEFTGNVDYEDLLGSGFLKGQGFIPDSGYKVTADVTNNSKDSLMVWADKKSGWPSVTCGFAAPLDISAYTAVELDAQFTNAYKWIGMSITSIGEDGKEQTSGELGFDCVSDGWETVTFRLAGFEKVNLKKVTGIRLHFNLEDGLTPGKTAGVYIDNLALRMAPPSLEPGNPPAAETDNDLISGDFTAAGFTKGSSGAMKVADVTNGSKQALLAWANTKSGWPNTQFIFSGAQDWSGKATLNLDARFIDAHKWLAVQLIGRDAAGNLILSNEVGYDFTAAGWETAKLDLTKFTGVDLSKVQGIRLSFNLNDNLTAGTLAQVYVDNVHAEEKPPVADDDLIGTSSSVEGTGFTAGVSGWEKQTVVTNGSAEALHAYATAASGWPNLTLWLGGADWSGLDTLTLDTKFADASQWFSVRLITGDDWKTSNEVGFDVASADWTTIKVPLSAFADVDLTKVQGLRIGLNLNDRLVSGRTAHVYLDNIRLSKAAPVTDDDILSDSRDRLSYNGSHYEMQAAVTNNSGEAFRAYATEQNGWPPLYIPFAAQQDLTGQESLQFDTRFIGTSKWVSVQLFDKDWKSVGKEVGVNAAAAAWSTNTVALTAFACTEEQLKAVGGIKVVFNFEEQLDFFEGNGTVSVYLDNMLLNEKTDDDLISINSSMEGKGFTDGISGWEKQAAITNGSAEALHAYATAAAGWPNFTLWFDGADWSGLDTLTLDTKFADACQWFSLKLITGHDWAASNEVGFDAASADWTTTEVSLSAFTGVDLTKVQGLRISLNLNDRLVSGKTAHVYLDNVQVFKTPVIDDDLISVNSLVEGKDFTDGVSGWEKQTEDTNGSAETLHAYATAAAGWPNFTLWFDGADWSGLDTLTLDTKFADACQWFSLKLITGDDWVTSNEVGFDVAADWTTTEVPLSAFTDVDLTKVQGLRINLNLNDRLISGKTAHVYLDNVRVFKAPVVDDDLISGCSSVEGKGFTDGVSGWEKQTAVTNGSAEALRAYATAASGWPNLTLWLDTAEDWSGLSSLSVDSLFENGKAWYSVKLITGDDWKESKEIGWDAADAWSTKAFALKDFDNGALDLAKVHGIRIAFNLNDSLTDGKTANVWLDNIVTVP